MPTYLAMDLGAESGRGVLVHLDGGRVRMEEIHRFANRPVRMAQTLYWDFPFQYAEILAALRICAEKGVRPAIDRRGHLGRGLRPTGARR